jgi:hypothetical protein
MYPENDNNAQRVLADLTSLQFEQIGNVGVDLLSTNCPFTVYISEEREGGTQLKLIMHYVRDIKALFKPKR